MAKKNQTLNRLTKDDVIAWYDETDHTRRGRLRLQRLWSVYSLHPSDVWALIKQQKGRCPMCGELLTLEAGTGKGIAIDHEGEKKKGRVRGVLHPKCNQYVLGHLEANYGDLSDKEKTGNIAHRYLSKPPAKKIKVGDSNLYDDKIEDRKKRGRTGRICQREGCEKEIPATRDGKAKYCEDKCRAIVSYANRRNRRNSN